jgi:hypothetical protein
MSMSVSCTCICVSMRPFESVSVLACGALGLMVASMYVCVLLLVISHLMRRWHASVAFFDPQVAFATVADRCVYPHYQLEKEVAEKEYLCKRIMEEMKYFKVPPHLRAALSPRKQISASLAGVLTC